MFCFFLSFIVKEMQELTSLFKSREMHVSEEKVREQAPAQSHCSDP